MAPLLSLPQQQAIKIISPNWAATVKVSGGVSNYYQLAQEVEDSKLRDLLGIALLQDVQDNPTEAKNITLLDGGTFEDCNGNTIKFKGLRYILAYFNYSEWLIESKTTDTFVGNVVKNRNETQLASSGDNKRKQGRAQESGLQEWELVKQFLNDNTDIYDLWNCQERKRPFTPRIIGIKRTIL